MNDVIALLLDDSMPAGRLGELLRAARKRRGWRRRDAAGHVGISAARLREYERGTMPVPPEVCAALAEAYGEDLTAHVPLRVPPRVDDGWLSVGEVRVSVEPMTEEAIQRYAQMVVRLRHARPGETLPLRAADLSALASALGADRDEIEARIVDLLGCPRDEARHLHAEMLRRKVLVSVAGLLAGAGLVGGIGIASAQPSHDSPPARPTIETVAKNTPAPDTNPVVDATVPAPTPAPAAPAAEDPAAAAAVSVPATPATPPAPAVTTDTSGLTDATVPADEVQPDARVHDPTEPRVSIPEGETFTEIGDAATAP